VGRNVEIKARVGDSESTRARVEQMADGPAEVLDQRDVFFHMPRGRLKLRVFPDGRGELISYVRSDEPGPALSDYRIVRTANPGGLESFLGELLGVRGVVKKRRLLYQIGPTRVHLDNVEGLGSFLELEAVLREDETEAEGARAAERILAGLGLGDRDRVACAYIDLLEGAEG
jgi:predicted adenylyl cyclase CyaB